MTYVGAVPTTGDFKLLDSITTSSTTTFNLRQGGVAVYPQSANHCIVQLNGINQVPGSSFNIVNDTIVFASSLSSSDVINQILVLGNVNDIGVPSDDTVSTAKLQANAVTTAKITDGNITAAKFNADVISGQTELASEPSDTDEFLVSDGGVIKRIDYSLIKGGANWEKLTESTLSSYNHDTKDDETAAMFSGNHDLYRYYIYDYQPQNDNSYLSIRFRINGTYASDNNYEYHMQKTYSGSSSYTAATSGANTAIETIQNLGNASDERHMMMVEYHRPNTTTHYHMIKVSGISMRNDNDIQTLDGVGYYRGSTNILNGLRFFASAGNLENWHLVGYGLKSP